jgi:folate-dependent phosphoribosylglycinamide formyltransferase PurN
MVGLAITRKVYMTFQTKLQYMNLTIQSISVHVKFRDGMINVIALGDGVPRLRLSLLSFSAKREWRQFARELQHSDQSCIIFGGYLTIIAPSVFSRCFQIINV